MRPLVLVTLVCSLGIGLAGLVADTPAQDAGCRWSAGFHVSDLDDEVNALVVFDDGAGPALYAGGSFAAANGRVVNGIARWDGVRWSPLSGPSGTGVEFPPYLDAGDVRALTVFDDGSGAALYAGGDFTTAGGVAANNIARWDGTGWFPVGAGIDGGVYGLAVYDDGTGPALVAGGDFTAAGEVVVNHVARWNGTSWSALGTGTDDTVNALAAGDLGAGAALYAGGDFLTAGGVTVNRVARWDGGGWSAMAGGVAGGTSPSVQALAVVDLGAGPALHAGGSFTTAGGVTVNNVARWTGSAWAALGVGTSSDVLALAVGDLGSGVALYVGGLFATAGGVTVNGIARWDGGGWSALSGPAGTGAGGVKALTVRDEGPARTLFAGGWLENAGGVPANRIARWDGSAWSSLSPLSGAGIDQAALALAVHDDGSGPALYAAGVFWIAGGVPASGVARWDGTSWSALSGPSGTGISGVFVDTLVSCAAAPGPALFAGGWFYQAGGLAANNVARWDGSSWSALSGPSANGTSGAVNALACLDSGSGPMLFAGGPFTTAGGVTVNGVARWDGSAWSALSGPTGTGTSGGAYAMAVFDDGSGPALYVGGGFVTAGGITVNGIARWDGGAWSALSGPAGVGVGGGDYPGVDALTVFDDGSGAALYVAGGFTSAGGISVNHIARWSGSSWSEVPGADALQIDGTGALAVHDDGHGPALYLAINPDSTGQAPLYVARWDGSSWGALSGPAGAGFDQPIASLASFDDGSGPALFAGGYFRSAGGVVSEHIARYSCTVIFADGFESGDASAWSAVVP